MLLPVPYQWIGVPSAEWEPLAVTGSGCICAVAVLGAVPSAGCRDGSHVASGHTGCNCPLGAVEWVAGF
jgi:hypothetical protein